MAMICYFKYGDNHTQVEDLLSARSSKQLQNNLRSSKSSKTKLLMTEENKTLVINPDCFIQILIDYLATEMNFDKHRELDICDSNGDLLQIKKLHPWESSSTVLTPLRTYCVVLFERNEQGGVKSFEILLNNGSDLHTSLLKKLKKYVFGTRSDKRLSELKGGSKSTPRMLNYDRSPRRRSIRSMSSRSSKSQTIL